MTVEFYRDLGDNSREDVGASPWGGVLDVVVAGHVLGHDGDGVFGALAELQRAGEAADAGSLYHRHDRHHQHMIWSPGSGGMVVCRCRRFSLTREQRWTA